MARKIFARHVTSESERARIKIYCSYGGFFYRIVAARIYGNGHPRYVPSNAEVARIGKIAREEELSSRAWRRGEATEAKQLLNFLGRSKISAKKRAKVKLSVA